MSRDWREYDWQLLETDRPLSAHMHMALEEVLIEEVAQGRRQAALRFWEWQSATVVLGRFQSVRNEVDPEGARRHDVTVVRRITGGGAMFAEPPNAITWSLYVPEELVKGMSFVESYAYLDDWVLRALRTMGVDAFYVPINDISSSGGKIGGAAQTRRQGVVLHHVMMSYDMNTAKMLEVLRIGKEKLSDKGTTSAARRVTPLREQSEMTRADIIARLTEAFRADHGLQHSTLTEAELAAAEELVRQKFATEEWTNLLP